MVMRSKISLLCLVFAFSGLFSLSLQEAKSLALKNNLSLSSSDYERQKSKKQYRQALGEAFLQVNLVGGYSYTEYEYPDTYTNYVNSMNAFKSQVATMTGNDLTLGKGILALNSATLSSEKQTDFAYGIEATQILSQKVPFSVSMVGDAADLSQKQYELKKQEILFNASKYYYALLLAKERLQVQEQALDIAEKNFSRVKSMYSQGLVSQYDYLRARLEVTKQKPQMEAADKDLVLATQNFKNYIRWDEGANLEITDSLVAPSMQGEDLNGSVKKGLEARKEIEIAGIATKIKKKDYRMEQLSFLPDFQLGFAYKIFSQSSDRSVETSDMGNYWQVTLGASMPLFTSFARFNKVSVKEYAWRQAREDELNARDLVKLDIQNSYHSLQQAKKSWLSQTENLGLAQKAFSIAQGRYQNGVSTQLEFLDATLQQNVAKLGYLNSIYEYIIACESYKLAIGEEL